jgi:hypothetical protein
MFHCETEKIYYNQPINWNHCTPKIEHCSENILLWKYWTVVGKHPFFVICSYVKAWLKEHFNIDVTGLLSTTALCTTDQTTHAMQIIQKKIIAFLGGVHSDV